MTRRKREPILEVHRVSLAAPRRAINPNAPAPVAGGDFNRVRGSDRRAHWCVSYQAAGVEQTDLGLCEYRADDPQPGDLWLFDSYSHHRWHRRAAGHHRPGTLLLTAHYSWHIYRNQWRGPGCPRGGPRDGHDRLAVAVASRITAGARSNTVGHS